MSMLQEATRQYIMKLTDAELYEYITVGTDRYEPKAVALARERFTMLCLKPERIAEIDAEVQAKLKREEAERSEKEVMPLGITGRVLAVIGGCFGLPLLLYILLGHTFRTQGEYRKARDLWLCGIIGLGAILLLRFILTILPGSG